MRMFFGFILACLDVYALLSGLWVYKSFFVLLRRAAGGDVPLRRGLTAAPALPHAWEPIRNRYSCN